MIHAHGFTWLWTARCSKVRVAVRPPLHPPGNDPANAPGKAGSLVDLAGLLLVRRWPRAPVPWIRNVGQGRQRHDPTFACLACSAVSAPGGCITRCVCLLPLRGRCLLPLGPCIAVCPPRGSATTLPRPVVSPFQPCGKGNAPVGRIDTRSLRSRVTTRAGPWPPSGVSAMTLV